MARTDPHFRLRIAEVLKARITKAAKEHNRSINSEITYLLEYALDSIELYNASSSAPFPDDAYIEKELSKRHVPMADASDATTLSRKIEEESKATQMALSELSAELAKLRMKIIDAKIAPAGNEFTIKKASAEHPDYSPLPLPPKPETEADKLELIREMADRLGYEVVKRDE